MKSLSIIGCGKVGSTLARLWHDQQAFVIQDILNQTLASGQKAAEFIGAGRPVQTITDLQPADVYLITTSDKQIEPCCQTLAESGTISSDTIVFHCSGSLTSEMLVSAKKLGAKTASVHPIKSFADKNLAAQTFAGTFCGVEGDEHALSVLQDAIQQIGGQCVTLDPKSKQFYQVANVMGSNYLVTLIDSALNTYQKAGISREQARQMIRPLIQGTLENVFEFDTTDALTGPIARGEESAVADHLQVLSDWDKEMEKLYKILGKQTLKLAQKTGKLTPKTTTQLVNLLT